MQSVREILPYLALVVLSYYKEKMREGKMQENEYLLESDVIASLGEDDESKPGMLVPNAIYLRVCSSASGLPSVREDSYYVHQKIMEASGGVISRLGFPVVECPDAYKVLISQLFVVEAAIEPLKPDGYRYPSSSGQYNFFVVPRSMLLDVILEVVGD